MDDHAETQAELQAVKKALKDDAVYLGMKGETLQRYLLQLNEKENLLLSAKLRQQSLSEGGGFMQTTPSGGKGAVTNGAAKNGGGYAAAAVPEGLAAARDMCGPADVPVEIVKPREPPAGPVRALDRENLDAVVSHLSDYEASVLETTRALRALSSLAYADATRVGTTAGVLPQVLRVLKIHPNDDNVQLPAMRAFCNMAYSSDVALNSLASDEGVLCALVGAMAKTGGPKEIGAKASEAVARIVTAEAEADAAARVKEKEEKEKAEQAKNEAEHYGREVPATVVETINKPINKPPGSLCGLFVAASSGDSSWQGVALQLVLQLIANEVVVPSDVAKNFAFAASGAQRSSASSAGWLQLAKQFASCTQVPELAQALVEAGAIQAAAGVMTAHVEDGSAQLAGIEGLSSLVGNRWAGLQAFAEVNGMQRVEAAMRQHPGDVVLQTKGVRALASGIQWPEDVQKRSKYSWECSVVLTKMAMSQHGSNFELQIAALEALAKYLDRMHCIAEVKADGGEGLVKAMMTRHMGVQKVQTYGKLVLDAVGAVNWAPKGASAQA